MERIVKGQRQILADVTGKDPATIPQVWTLYKEVQDYYDKGMRVPDDVTLMVSDDNWGNIRRIPLLDEPARQGGWGIYYHFDYVGGPRNYKWLNTNAISRVWEQMHLGYEHGMRQIWIVNVGDIKPVEFPLEFFMDYAWNPESWPVERLPQYTERWAERQFGKEHSAAIADIIARYTKYNARRKPELLGPDTYSLVDYHEAERVTEDYKKLADAAEAINNVLPDEYKDAYYQLVLHPVQACANLSELYLTVGKNHLYAKQGRAATNDLALRAEELFDKDAQISYYYNQIMAGGKWNHMMDQTHIGYTSWQQPETNIMPEVAKVNVLAAPEMGVAIEGSDRAWPLPPTEPAGTEPVLPEFSPYQRQPSQYIEVFNRGQVPFEYQVESGAPYVVVMPSHGIVEKEARLTVWVDFGHAPAGTQKVPITVSGPNKSSVVVQAVVNNNGGVQFDPAEGAFVESNGYVSMEAEHYTRAVSASPLFWQRIPDLGRTASAMTVFPVTAQAQSPGADSPRSSTACTCGTAER